MKAPLTEKRLNRFAAAEKDLIDNWKEGASIASESQTSFDQLIQFAASDRWRLAEKHRSAANKLAALNPPQHRAAISRYYYSMYHSMRACVYVFNKGDDHQAHRVLPKKIPSDFPSPDYWETKLKDALAARNAADYDPYPKANSAWRKLALQLQRDASELTILARAYLRKKGCKP